MDTILDYILWTREIPFTVRDVGDVDSVVFSFLSYMDLRELLSSGRKLTVAACCQAMLEDQEGMTERHRDLYKAISASRRFGPVVVASYMDTLVEEDAVQFSAMLFCVRPDLNYIAFRGTDNTIAGWKEDFVTSFSVTGGQRMAARYLSRHLKRGMMYDIGGHSKGGNLAMYALSQMDDRKLKLVRHVYLHDAPGLCPDVMDVGPLERGRKKITRFTPAFGIVGRLFERPGDESIIVQSSAAGIMQHDIETWGVDHGELLRASEEDSGARLINETVASWLGGVDTGERQRFVDDLFQAVTSGGAKTVEDLGGQMDQVISHFAASASKETREAAARLPAAAFFGRYADRIWSLRLVQWMRTSELAAALTMLVFGYLFQLMPVYVMGITVAVVLCVFAFQQTLITLRHLLDNHWDLKGERVRVYICIMLISLAYMLFVKDQALFNLSSLLFGILFLVLGYNNAIRLRKSQRWTVPWIRHFIMMIMYAYVGIFVTFSAEHTVTWYAQTAGTLMVVDGMTGVVHWLQTDEKKKEKKRHKRKDAGNL